MPEPFTTYKNNVAAAWLYVVSDLNNFYNDMYYLADHLADEGNPWSSQDVYNACIHIWDLKNHISGGSPSMRITFAYCLNWIDDNWPSDGDGFELDMSKILEAVWESSPLETFFFVNYVDGMRASILNKRIEKEKLADIYRHFLT